MCFFPPASYIAHMAGWIVLELFFLLLFCFVHPPPPSILQLWFWKCWEGEISDPSRCRATVWSETQKLWKGRNKRWSPEEIGKWGKKCGCSLNKDDGILECWSEIGKPLLSEMMTCWELLAEIVLVLTVTLSMAVSVSPALAQFPVAVQNSALLNLSLPYC